MSGDGTRETIETWRYDSDGRKTRIRFLRAYDPDARVSTYGVEGTKVLYGAPGASTLTIAYDARELPAEATLHDMNGGVVRRIVFSRDSNGRLATEVAYFGGETPFPDLWTRVEAAPLAEREKIIGLMQTVFADGVFSRVTYAYDSTGRLIERTMRMGSLSEERVTFEYNELGNSIAETIESVQQEMQLDADDSAHHTEGDSGPAPSIRMPVRRTR